MWTSLCTNKMWQKCDGKRFRSCDINDTPSGSSTTSCLSQCAHSPTNIHNTVVGGNMQKCAFSFANCLEILLKCVLYLNWMWLYAVKGSYSLQSKWDVSTIADILTCHCRTAVSLIISNFSVSTCAFVPDMSSSPVWTTQGNYILIDISDFYNNFNHCALICKCQMCAKRKWKYFGLWVDARHFCRFRCRTTVQINFTDFLLSSKLRQQFNSSARLFTLSQ